MKGAAITSSEARTDKSPHKLLQRTPMGEGDSFKSLMSLFDAPKAASLTKSDDEPVEEAPAHEKTEPATGLAQPPWYPSLAVTVQNASSTVDMASTEQDPEGEDPSGHPPAANARGERTAGHDLHTKMLLPLTANDAQRQDQVQTMHQIEPVLPRMRAWKIEVQPEHAVGETPKTPLEADGENGIAPSFGLPVLAATGLTVSPASSDGSPAHQIISALRETAPQGDADCVRQVETKVLRMRLRPEALGEVEVVLRHTAGELRIHILVSHEATAQALHRDLNLLEDRLGLLLTAHSPRAITIAIHPDSQMQGSDFGQGGPPAGGSGSFGTQAEAQGGRSSPRKEEMAFGWKTGNRDDETPSLQRSVSGLVV